MFTELFNTKQKKVFLSIAEDLLKADDGSIDDLEQKYFLQVCKEIRLLPKDKEVYKLEKINEIFSEDESKRALLIECIFLAYSNGEYHQNQEIFINNIAKSFSIGSDDINTIQNEINDFTKIQENLLNYVFGED